MSEPAPRATIDPIPVSEEDLKDCDEILALTSNKASVLVPWAVDSIEKFNECAAGKANLAAKVREHNKKRN